MDKSEIENTLESCELFNALGRDQVRKIAALCEMKTLGAGESIFRQGDFGEHLYIIADGQVFLERSMDLDSRQGNVLIGILGVGRAFGCWSTLLGDAHNLMSSAICRNPVKIAVIKGEDLRAMLLSDTEVGFKVLERLCFLLRDRIEGAYGAMEKV